MKPRRLRLRGARRFFLPALAGLLLLTFWAAVPAQVPVAETSGAGSETEVAIPAAPQRWLTDEAGFLSPATASELDARLEEYERSSGHQVIIYIGRTTGIVPIEDWALRAFEKWKVGRRGLDDGLVLFIMAADKRVRVEVGYGLEGIVPDALAGRIIRDEVAPRLQAGDNDGAVRAAVDRLTAIISATGTDVGGGEARKGEGRPMTLSEKILLGIGLLFLLILFITNPSLAIYLLFSILSGGRGGGGGGGGFSGGGGRSGGGGASGGW